MVTPLCYSCEIISRAAAASRGPFERVEALQHPHHLRCGPLAQDDVPARTKARGGAGGTRKGGGRRQLASANPSRLARLQWLSGGMMRVLFIAMVVVGLIGFASMVAL
jgi:hypothetical protein